MENLNAETTGNPLDNVWVSDCYESVPTDDVNAAIARIWSQMSPGDRVKWLGEGWEKVDRASSKKQ